MEHIERFPNLPDQLPATVEELRDLMRLAFEEGDASGAIKAYSNAADQLAAVPGWGPLVADCRRWAGALNARFRRVRADLEARGWGAE